MGAVQFHGDARTQREAAEEEVNPELVAKQQQKQENLQEEYSSLLF